MKKSDLIKLSKNIKKRRKILGYTQEEFSEKIDLSHSHYSKIENAISSPSLDTLIKISKVLDISLDHIIFDDKKKIDDINYIKFNNILNDLKNNKEQKIADLKTLIKLLDSL